MTEQTFEIEVDGQIFEVTYVTHDCLTSGDYGGYGYLGECNIDVIETEKSDTSCGGSMGWRGLERAVESNAYVSAGKLDAPDVVTLHGGYNSKELWLRAGEYADEIIGALEGYPVLDDGAVSEYECNAFEDQYPDLMHDARVAIEQEIDYELDGDEFDRVYARFESLDDDATDSLLREVNDGELPIEQDNGYQCQWFLTDVELHAENIVRILQAETDPSPLGCALRIRRDNLMGDLFVA